MTVRMWHNWWYQFWYHFFLEFFAIWKILFLLSLLHQIPLEFLLTQHLSCVKNCSDHYSECDSASHPFTGLSCLPPVFGNYSKLYSDCTLATVEPLTGQDCLHSVHVNYSEHYSESDPVQPCTEPSCLPLVHVYSRDTLLSLNQNAEPLDSKLVTTLSDLGIARRSRPRRSRPGGRRKQRKIPVLSLSSSTEIRTPDSLHPDCWPPADVYDNALSDPDESGDVYGTTSLNVTDCDVSPHPPSSIQSPVPCSPQCRTPDHKNPLPFADASFSSSVSDTVPCAPAEAGECGPVPPSPHRSPTSNLIDVKSSSRDHSLSMCVFNAQSVGLRYKRVNIVEFIHDEQVDIMFLTETWLKTHGDEAKLASLTPAGYCLKSQPRSSRAGGVAVIYREHFPITVKSKFPFKHDSFEVMQVTLTTHVCVHLFCVYRPPPSDKNKLTDAMFYTEFPDLLEFANSLQGKTVFLGDFNFHYDNKTRYSTVRMLDILSTFGLEQAVTEPTQRSGHILDWVLYRPEENIVRSCFVSHGVTSDHFAVLCELDFRRPLRLPVYCEVRNLKAVNMDAFKSDVCALLASSTSLSAGQLCDGLRALLDNHAPATQRKVPRRRSTPWYGAVAPQLRALKQEKRRAERQWLRTGLTVHKDIFNAVKHKITRLVDKAKTTFLNAKVSACTTCKQLYSVTNKLMNKTKSTVLPSSPLSSLPQMFCDFFVSKVSDIRSAIDKSCPSGNQPSDHVSFCGTPLKQFHPVDESFVLKTIRSMNPTSCELDPIPTSILLQCIDDLLPAITDMINDCFASGSFPSVFKQAVVKPLLKKSNLDPNVLSNYRPVSNLSFLSKLVEKIAVQQLLEHVTHHDLLPHFQSAYRLHHSTETALLRVLNDLLCASDESKVSVLTLLDLSAAFDTIDHSILITRLKNVFGVHDFALSFLQSYLTDRTQTVFISGHFSDPAPLAFGVPQGSVLGPLLFLLYTQPLAQIIEHHSVSHAEFADDTQLYNSSSLSNIQSLLSCTESCIKDVKDWMTFNKLQLNDKKTEALLIDTAGNLDNSLRLTVGESQITFSDSVRNLGVMFDNKLSMKIHVNKVCQIAYLELRRIGTIRHYLTTQATKTLISSFVLSRLDYGNSLLAGIPDSLLKKLQKVQNCAARLIFQSPKLTSSAPLLEKLHWLPVAERVKYKTATMCFNIINQTAPKYLSDTVSIYTPSRTLRSSADTRLFKIPRYNKKTQGQRAFSRYAPLLWNSLPFAVRHCETPDQFKKSLKNHLFRSAYHN